MKKNLTLISLMLGVMIVLMVSGVSANPCHCGDGIIQWPNYYGNYEECDGSNLDGETCESLGFDGGTLSCDMVSLPFDNCKFDTSGCYYDQECNDCSVDIINPEEGLFYCVDELLIDWTAEGEDCGDEWDVYSGTYDGNECVWDVWLGETHFITEFPWDTSGLSDGEYCVKVTGACCEAEIEGPFCMDCTAPEAEICIECCDSEGIESDEQTPETETVIEISYEDVENDCDQKCELECTIDWGDETSDDCDEVCGIDELEDDECSHQYADNGDYTVTLTVEDCAENTGTDEQIVHVENVIPVCTGITADSDVAVGQLVSFTGSATDVDADLPLIYNWDFDDGDTAEDENPTTHIYTADGIYTVTLTVEDKDGGVSDPVCTHEIEVHEPIELTDQEVAAFYPLNADFGEGGGLAPFQFSHGITGWGNCQKVIGPANLFVGSDGGYACGIHWHRDGLGATANPTNAERGEHQVIVKVTNGTNVEYYSFKVKVYSWIIPLDEEWNLMSIPLTAEDSKSTNVFDYNSVGEQIEQIWSYQYNSDTDESEWSCVKPTSSAGTSCGTGITKLTTVEPGNAYWVKLKDVPNPQDAPELVKGMGISPNEVQGGPMLPPLVDVPTNSWSLIGRYGIIGKDYHPEYDPDRERVHGYLREDIALDSLTKLDNDMHVYDEDFTIVDELFNNEGYWLWIEDNAFNNAGFESYAPIDEWYPKNSGITILGP